jgi:hypothetical protein
MKQVHVILIAMAAAAWCPATMHAQSKTETPNISGAWAGTWNMDPKTAKDPKLIPPAPGLLMLKAPYSEQYEKRRAAERAADERGEPLGNTSTMCLPDGMPQMMFAIYPLEILQSPGRVTIIEEAFSQVRRIYLDEPQAKIGDVPPGYYGHSVGRWDGDTLVVDTIGVKESVLGYRSMPHGDQMRITERIRLAGPDILWDQITVEDPLALEKPWTFTFGYRRTPNYKMQEYVCENNRDYVDEHGATQLRLSEH